MSRLTLTLFVLLLIPLNAMAVEINDQGAEKLKTSFQNILDYQKNVSEAMGTVDVQFEGALDVKQEAEYYAVTFPRILLKSPKGADPSLDNVSFDMGVITVNAIPDDKPGYWKMVLSFPNTMTFKDDETGENFVISFNEQNNIAMFHEGLGYFTKMHLNLTDMKFSVVGKDLGVNLGKVQLYSNLDETENTGVFTGPSRVSVTDLVIAPAEEDEVVKIAEVYADVDMTDIKLPTLKEYEAKFMKHANVFKQLNDQTAQNPDQLSTDEAPVPSDDQIANMLMDLYSFDVGGFSIEYGLKGLDITSKPEAENKNFDNLKVGSAFFGTGMNGLNKGDKGTMRIKLGYSDVAVLPTTLEDIELVPESLNLDIKAINIPYAALTDTMKNGITSISQSPETAQMVGMGLMMKVPAILSQAGTEVVIEENGAKNKVYDVSLNGKMKTDLTSLMGFSGKFIAVFEGLDKVLQMTQGNMKHAQLNSTLEMLKSYGLAGNGPNGKPAYTFAFEATPEGQFLINGKDPNAQAPVQ